MNREGKGFDVLVIGGGPAGSSAGTFLARGGMRVLLLEHYYTTPFMELLLQPRAHFDLPAAVIAVLAGEVEGSWALRWRVKYFFLLVKLQSRMALVPRLSFAGVSGLDGQGTA